MTDTCSISNSDRRRIFWTTQPDACGVDFSCGDTCGKPGLQLKSVAGGKSFANNDYVRGLALNILLTDGRREATLCGYRPGSRGGHWADSFREDGQKAGSLLRLADTRGQSVSDSIATLQAFAEADLQKLVISNVATQIKVTMAYAGRGKLSMSVEIIGRAGDVTRVGAIGSQLGNAWVWN